MKTVLLGDVCDVIGGGTPSKSNKAYYKGTIPWATVRDMNKELLSDTEFHITESAVKKSSTNVIPKDSLIIASRVGLGKACILLQDTAINQDLRAIVPKNKKTLDTHYLFQWFKSIKNQVINAGTGATVQGVKLPFIKSLAIPFPEIKEQKRIVKKLDEAFEKIDKAIENTEKNLKNSQELFETTLSQTFSKPADDWTEGRLDTFCVLQRGHDLPKAQRVSGQYPLASSSGVIDTHNQAKTIGPGVFTGRSGSIGNIFYIEEDYWPLNTVLYVKEFFGNDPKLIYYLIKSLDFIKYAGGTGVPTLNRNIVHQVKVNFPPKSEQKVIVKKLDKLSEQTQKLKKLYQQKLDGLEELKQSLLKQAFEGKL